MSFSGVRWGSTACSLHSLDSKGFCLLSSDPRSQFKLLLPGSREPLRMLNLDAARVWDHVLSSGDTLASRVRWRAGRMLCVIFLLTVALQLAAKKACSYDIIISVQTLINSTSSLVRPPSFNQHTCELLSGSFLPTESFNTLAVDGPAKFLV